VKKAKAKPSKAKPAAKVPPAKAIKATKPSLVNAPAIRELADVLAQTGLSEIEYEAAGLRIRVARNGGTGGMAPAPVYAQAPAAPVAETAAPAKAVDPASHPGTVKSPMVGMIYLLPEPGAAPFIKVGDSVAEGQTLALIEAMKTFNPVKAPRSGKVIKIFLENGSPVEYGEPLVIIE
jgi:acetyl-CoA carboxylase biotin carboxyl carrier protein